MRVVRISYLIAEFPSLNPYGFCLLDSGNIYIPRKLFNPLKHKIENYFKGLEKVYICSVSVISNADEFSSMRCLIRTYDQFIEWRKDYISKKIMEYAQIKNEYAQIKNDSIKPEYDDCINSLIDTGKRCEKFFSVEMEKL